MDLGQAIGHGLLQHRVGLGQQALAAPQGGLQLGDRAGQVLELALGQVQGHLVVGQDPTLELDVVVELLVADLDRDLFDGAVDRHLRAGAGVAEKLAQGAASDEVDADGDGHHQGGK